MFLLKIEKLLVYLFCASLCFDAVCADGPAFPPVELKEEWATIEKKGFNDWKNIKFFRWDTVLDGGSIVFKFQTENSIEFNIVVANRNYWTQQDIDKKKQVIYVTESHRFYLLEPGSVQEKHLMKLLQSADVDSVNSVELDALKDWKGILKRLCDTITSRKEIDVKFPIE